MLPDRLVLFGSTRTVLHDNQVNVWVQVLVDTEVEVEIDSDVSFEEEPGAEFDVSVGVESEVELSTVVGSGTTIEAHAGGGV